MTFTIYNNNDAAFSAVMLSVGWQEGQPDY